MSVQNNPNTNKIMRHSRIDTFGLANAEFRIVSDNKVCPSKPNTALYAGAQRHTRGVHLRVGTRQTAVSSEQRMTGELSGAVVPQRHFTDGTANLYRPQSKPNVQLPFARIVAQPGSRQSFVVAKVSDDAVTYAHNSIHSVACHRRWCI
jgi:hypothetical protein